jgi:hypothetical protein
MPEAGYVYMIHGIETRYVKIGKTTNLVRRLQDLARGVPFPVQLLSAQLVPDMDAEEQRLLVAYAASRTRGEWFEFDEALLAQWATSARLALPDRTENAKRRPDHSRQLTQAMQWLRERLMTGPRFSTELISEAEQAGLALRTVQRAKVVLDIVSTKHARGPWLWALPTLVEDL